MRVLFLHQFDLGLAGGSGTYLRHLCRALIDQGHRPEVVAARVPDAPGWPGCPIHPLPFDFTLTFGPERRPGERTFGELTVAELRALADDAAAAVGTRLLDRTASDLILVNHISLTARVALSLLERYGTPYRVISYGTDTQLLQHDPRYVDLFGPAASKAAGVFAISRFVAQQVRDVLPGVDVEVLGGAVDPHVFRPATRPVDPNRLVFVGRLVTEKGLWTLLDALDLLDADVRLDVVGEGPLLAELRDASERRGLSQRVRFVGYVPPGALRDLLVRCALAVVPSLWDEPLGLVVLEAMACGVPIVASAVGGIPEMVRDGRNGLLVEPGDAHALASAIDRVLREPALRWRLSQQCTTGTPIPTYGDLARRLVA